MLTVLTGEDRAGLLAELDRALAQHAPAGAERFAEGFSAADVLGLLEQSDLFGAGPRAIVLDGIVASPEGREFLENEAERFASSSRAVYVIEASIPAALKKKIEGAGGTVRSIGREEKKRSSPAVFALSDALIARDKKSLWLIYQELSRNAEAEELAGTLIWQLKVLSLVMRGETGGLNPYVVTKARAGLRNYTEEEVKKLHFSLVDLYHRGHRGEGNMALSLEQIILSL